MSLSDAQVFIEPHEAYHSRGGQSASKIKDFIESPRGYFRKHYLGLKDKPTATMDFGTAVHEDVLLEACERSYLEIPPEVLTKDGKKSGNAWKAYQEENKGRLLLKAKEIDSINRMLFAMKAHPLASTLLKDMESALKEITITAMYSVLDVLPDGQCVADKIEIRSRLDYVGTNATRRILDLKTTGDLSPRAMRYKPYDAGWDIQGETYRCMYHALTGEWLDVDFLVVENCEPYRVEVWTPNADTLGKANTVIASSIQEIYTLDREYARTRDESIWNRAGYAERNMF